MQDANLHVQFHVDGFVVNYGVSNTIVLEIP